VTAPALEIATRRLPDGTLHVALRGRVAERFEAARVVAEAGGGRVVVDLSGVRHVSSVGVRELEHFLGDLVASGPGARVVLVEVSAAIANQLVLLPTLSAGAAVESAQLPFVCARCGSEATATVPFVKGAATSHAPACRCGARMALDGIAEQYLPSE
jgi:anti-anti-sigma regulatory factor